MNKDHTHSKGSKSKKKSKSRDRNRDRDQNRDGEEDQHKQSENPTSKTTPSTPKRPGPLLTSPLLALQARYAVRSPFQSLGREEEDLNMRITNFDPVEENTYHTRCITAIRMSSDMTHPFIGELTCSGDGFA
jgi:hypothetical protein